MTVMEKRHKVYISYHHGQDDEYKDKFIKYSLFIEKTISTRDDYFGNISPDSSIKRTKVLIRERLLRDTTVTVVLVGADTWKRKHTDWEISASISDTNLYARSGLVGILLPTHPDYSKNKVNPFTIPPRLHDNIEHRYAKLYKWTEDPLKIQEWIHESFSNRQNLHPYNGRPEFISNRVGQNSW